MIKTTYYCDYCGQQVESRDSLRRVRLEPTMDSATMFYHDFGDLCAGCLSKLDAHLREAIDLWGDNAHGN